MRKEIVDVSSDDVYFVKNSSSSLIHVAPPTTSLHNAFFEEHSILTFRVTTANIMHILSNILTIL